MEYDLLRVFVQNPLRRKLEIDPSKPQIIRTVRGAGYMFVPEPQQPPT